MLLLGLHTLQAMHSPTDRKYRILPLQKSVMSLATDIILSRLM